MDLSNKIIKLINSLKKNSFQTTFYSIINNLIKKIQFTNLTFKELERKQKTEELIKSLLELPTINCDDFATIYGREVYSLRESDREFYLKLCRLIRERINIDCKNYIDKFWDIPTIEEIDKELGVPSLKEDPIVKNLRESLELNISCEPLSVMYQEDIYPLQTKNPELFIKLAKMLRPYVDKNCQAYYDKLWDLPEFPELDKDLDELKSEIVNDLLKRFKEIQATTPKKLTIGDLIDVQIIAGLYNIAFPLYYEESRKKHRRYLNCNISQSFKDALPQLEKFRKKDETQFMNYINSIRQELLFIVESEFSHIFKKESDIPKSLFGKRFTDSNGIMWELVNKNDLNIPYFSKVINGKVQKKQFVLDNGIKIVNEWRKNTPKPKPTQKEDIPIGEISVKTKDFSIKLELLLEGLYGKVESLKILKRIEENEEKEYFSEYLILEKGDLIYFKSRKAYNIPFKIIKINTHYIDKGIFGAERYYYTFDLLNLETQKLYEKKESQIFTQSYLIQDADRIVRNEKIIWLEDPKWYENLKKEIEEFDIDFKKGHLVNNPNISTYEFSLKDSYLISEEGSGTDIDKEKVIEERISKYLMQIPEFEKKKILHWKYISDDIYNDFKEGIQKTTSLESIEFKRKETWEEFNHFIELIEEDFESIYSTLPHSYYIISFTEENRFKIFIFAFKPETLKKPKEKKAYQFGEPYITAEEIEKINIIWNNLSYEEREEITTYLLDRDFYDKEITTYRPISDELFKKEWGSNKDLEKYLNLNIKNLKIITKNLSIPFEKEHFQQFWNEMINKYDRNELLTLVGNYDYKTSQKYISVGSFEELSSRTQNRLINNLKSLKKLLEKGLIQEIKHSNPLSLTPLLLNKVGENWQEPIRLSRDNVGSMMRMIAETFNGKIIRERGFSNEDYVIDFSNSSSIFDNSSSPKSTYITQIDEMKATYGTIYDAHIGVSLRYYVVPISVKTFNKLREYFKEPYNYSGVNRYISKDINY